LFASERFSSSDRERLQEHNGFGLGWAVYEGEQNYSHIEGICHMGAWPGQRCYAEYRPDGSSYTIQFGSEFPPENDIIDVPRKFLDQFQHVRHQFLDWREYGYPMPPRPR
jgi:hypothetical protein